MDLDAYHLNNARGRFGLTQDDSIAYIKEFAAEAAKYGMGTGPKNAEAILAVPLTLSLDVLQSRLETLADDLMVDLVLRTDV